MKKKNLENEINKLKMKKLKVIDENKNGDEKNNNFSGLSIEFLQNKFNNNNNLIRDYLDGWICYSLFIRDIIRFKLSWSKRIDLLCDHLK